MLLSLHIYFFFLKLGHQVEQFIYLGTPPTGVCVCYHPQLEVVALGMHQSLKAQWLHELPELHLSGCATPTRCQRNKSRGHGSLPVHHVCTSSLPHTQQNIV